MKLPVLSVPTLRGFGKGAIIRLKSTDGPRVEFSAGMMRVSERITRVLMIRRGGNVKDVTTIERSLGAGAGAAIGMLGGPVMSVVGAGMGAALAGRKSVLVSVIGEDGTRVDFKIAPSVLESLELAAGVEAC